jgi:hypothetical protein
MTIHEKFKIFSSTRLPFEDTFPAASSSLLIDQNSHVAPLASATSSATFSTTVSIMADSVGCYHLLIKNENSRNPISRR